MIGMNNVAWVHGGLRKFPKFLKEKLREFLVVHPLAPTKLLPLKA
jgi:hypothetical protein